MNLPPLLLDMKKLEQVICVGHTKIEEMVKAGNFPAPIYVGRYRRWKVAEVQAWVERQGTEVNYDV